MATVDNAEPSSTESAGGDAESTVTFTAIFSNENAQAALNTTLAMTLPDGLTYIPDTTTIHTPGWSFGDGPDARRHQGEGGGERQGEWAKRGCQGLSGAVSGPSRTRRIPRFGR